MSLLHFRIFSSWKIIAGTFALFFAMICAFGAFLGAVSTHNDLPTSSRREILIRETSERFSKLAGLVHTPYLVISNNTSSTSGPFGYSVITIEPDLLDESKFSDEDVRAVLGHEVGHISRSDSYRVWTKLSRVWAESRELNADRVAGQLAGCAAFRSLVNRHIYLFKGAYENSIDPHPAPQHRIDAACAADLKNKNTSISHN